jgi:hypothetical protein
MKKFFYFIGIALLPVCKTGKITSGAISNLEKGLYFKGDLFLIINSNVAISEYISESSNFIGLREAFNDTLHKQNDTLFIGKKFSLKLHEKKIFFDSYFDPKELYPIQLIKANDDARKRWNHLHNRLRLYGIYEEYLNFKSKLNDPIQKEKITQAYKNLEQKLDMEQLPFLEEINKFRKYFFDHL